MSIVCSQGPLGLQNFLIYDHSACLSIRQAIYINLSGITSKIQCSLSSSSKVSIRMGQFLLFIFTCFTLCIKQRAVRIIQINFLRKSSCKLRFFIEIFVSSLANTPTSRKCKRCQFRRFFKRRAPDCKLKYRPWI